MKIKRVFLIVLDSVGAGALPDAHLFGDVGSHTLRSAWKSGLCRLDTLRSLGLGNIEGLEFIGNVDRPLGACARMREASMGKDTTIGHWEISGLVSATPLPTFPQGFSEDVLDRIRKISGREVLCNLPYSGTAVIEDYGREALERGALIVYTSADSVLQIAAHTDAVSLEELYRICGEVREMLCEIDLPVGRVIARPFISDGEGFKRTADRRDYSLKPPRVLLPEAVKNAGLDSIAVGKISDIFADVGFSESQRTHSNREGMEIAAQYVNKDFRGLCFINLVDFDMLWGHRRDPEGYARGIEEFDGWLAGILPKLKEDDLLIVSADHGCDPSFAATTDHTREYTPLLIYGKRLVPQNYGTRDSFADIGATVAEALGVDLVCDGRPIALKLN